MHPKAHKYQIRATEFMLEQKRAYLMCDCGLGKTLMVLMAQDAIDEPFLIVAPLRPLYSTWPAEIRKWYPHKKFVMLHGKDKDYNYMADADFYLINPDGFKWLEQKSRPKYKHLVIDESSQWKSPSTKRFKMIKKMLGHFKYRFLLSGTPSPQGIMDLWSQYYILDGGKSLGHAVTKFRNQYFNLFLINNQFPEYTPKSGATQAVTEATRALTFRLDAADYLDMPELIYNNIMLELPKNLMKQYKELEKEFVLELTSYDVEAFNAASLSSKLRQFTAGGIYVETDEGRQWEFIHDIRIKALEALVEETGQPILVAIQFRFELEMLRKAFGSAVPYIGGGVSAKAGTETIEKWNRQEVPLLICHPAALAHGANLQTGGSVILFYSLTWSLEQYMQLIARLHRQGQKHAVIVHHFLMKNTIDERVAKALKAKESVQQAVLDFAKERS